MMKSRYTWISAVLVAFGVAAFVVADPMDSYWSGGVGGKGYLIFRDTGSTCYLGIEGYEACDAVLRLRADQADNTEDTWAIESEAADNDLAFVNGSTERMTLSAAGVLTVAGGIAAPLSGAISATTLSASSTADFNGEVTSTNITMDTGSTLAAKALTIATSLDVNAPATATNITLDAGAVLIGTTSLTLGSGTETVSINSSDWDIGTTGDMTGIGSITMNGALSGATEATVDGKYAAVGPDATTGLMVQTTNVTMHSGTIWTQTWTVVFGAAPVCYATYTEDPGDVRPIWVDSITPSNCLVNVAADKNFALVGIGARP